MGALGGPLSWRVGYVLGLGENLLELEGFFFLFPSTNLLTLYLLSSYLRECLGEGGMLESGYSSSLSFSIFGV